jgi:hypothetical protein
MVNVLDAELTVVKSDSAISESVREALKEGVKVLENVPDIKKDWHPGSDGKVLDLVHPSLFPLIYGVSRGLGEEQVPLDDPVKYTGQGEIIQQRADDREARRLRQGILYSNSLNPLWGSYHWLPSDIEITKEGAKILSYINNLHPVKHKALYGVLEQIVTATLPLWEECLSGFYIRRRIDINSSGSEDWMIPPGMMYHIPGREGEKAVKDPNTWEIENESDDSEMERIWDDYDEWKKEHRVIVQREPREYVAQKELEAKRPEPPEQANYKPCNFREQFPDGIQVIFKLANIHLTPEKPEYEGGKWHVEGALNEMICASAIYYYDQENISDSHLAFRHQLDLEEVIMIPEQNEHASLELFLGIEQDGPGLQRIGQILTKEGRLLVFPNCLHHQVQPFKLQDPTKPGHRKILAMFLVDPNRPILSTANIPPQQRQWWAEEVRENGALSALPNEIFNQTVRMVDDFPLSWEQALDIREKLMAERGKLNEEHEDFLTGNEVSSNRNIFATTMCLN